MTKEIEGNRESKMSKCLKKHFFNLLTTQEVYYRCVTYDIYHTKMSIHTNSFILNKLHGQREKSTLQYSEQRVLFNHKFKLCKNKCMANVSSISEKEWLEEEMEEKIMITETERRKEGPLNWGIYNLYLTSTICGPHFSDKLSDNRSQCQQKATKQAHSIILISYNSYSKKHPNIQLYKNLQNLPKIFTQNIQRTE